MNFNNSNVQKSSTAQYSLDTKHLPLKLFILCWIAYASAYLCRINISVVIPALQQSFGWNKASIGLIGSFFFWIYGIGQLINGYIGDKVPGRILIFIGLTMSAIANILFGFSLNMAAMIFFWAVNGFFQSMLWGPIVKILSASFPETYRTRISVGISTSMVWGYLLGWGLSGQILTTTSWHWVFRLPGILVFNYAIIWMLSTKKLLNNGLSADENQDLKKHSLNQGDEMPFWRFIKEKKLWMIAIVCMCQGIIKDSISLWGPAYLLETHNIDLSSTTSYILLIPIMNFGGILLSGWLNKKFNYHHNIAIMTIFGTSVIAFLGLFLFGRFSIVMGVILLGCCSALMYGANTLLLSVIPMGLTKYNKTSSVAGFLDFSSYMGAGMAGCIIGGISEHLGWNGVVIIWLSTALLAIGMLYKSSIDDEEV
ncbi:MFS transporter [Caldicoprobacter algeriensis]|uniref:MFS transporter n=1 Tax=Caldicoprobacter algeriensis TaxID=699281 RepID=UPI00207A8883|nr:MFS transporter [Caldicoprobacter algeriensis]MCM8901783.1 MFS transporter [Caldicoprobacter algeriensis]